MFTIKNSPLKAKKLPSNYFLGKKLAIRALKEQRKPGNDNLYKIDTRYLDGSDTIDLDYLKDDGQERNRPKHKQLGRFSELYKKQVLVLIQKDGRVVSKIIPAETMLLKVRNIISTKDNITTNVAVYEDYYKKNPTAFDKQMKILTRYRHTNFMKQKLTVIDLMDALIFLKKGLSRRKKVLSRDEQEKEFIAMLKLFIIPNKKINKKNK